MTAFSYPISLAYIYIKMAKVGLKLQIHKTDFILVLLLIMYYCIIHLLIIALFSIWTAVNLLLPVTIYMCVCVHVYTPFVIGWLSFQHLLWYLLFLETLYCANFYLFHIVFLKLAVRCFQIPFYSYLQLKSYTSLLLYIVVINYIKRFPIFYHLYSVSVY